MTTTKPQHTPEPWRVSPANNREVQDSRGIWQVAVCGINGDKNSRRIVACVNACEGMTTGDLEQDSAACTKTIKELATERDALREQNRRLREALRVLLPHLRANCAGSPVAVRHTSDAAALLAEIEGEK